MAAACCQQVQAVLLRFLKSFIPQSRAFVCKFDKKRLLVSDESYSGARVCSGAGQLWCFGGGSDGEGPSPPPPSSEHELLGGH